MEADEVMADNFMAGTTLWLLPLSGKTNKLSKSVCTMFSNINNKTPKNKFKMSQVYADVTTYVIDFRKQCY